MGVSPKEDRKISNQSTLETRQLPPWRCLEREARRPRGSRHASPRAGRGGGPDVLGSNQKAAAWPPSADRPDERLNHAAGKVGPARLTGHQPPATSLRATAGVSHLSAPGGRYRPPPLRATPVSAAGQGQDRIRPSSAISFQPAEQGEERSGNFLPREPRAVTFKARNCPRRKPGTAHDHGGADGSRGRGARGAGDMPPLRGRPVHQRDLYQ